MQIIIHKFLHIVFKCKLIASYKFYNDIVINLLSLEFGFYLSLLCVFYLFYYTSINH